MWISDMATHTGNHLLTGTPLQLQNGQCEASSQGRTPWAQHLHFTPETQSTRRGGGMAGPLRPWPGLGGQRRGRALMASDGQSRPGPVRMPRVGPTSVRRVRVNHAAEGRGSRKAGPIRGVKSVLLLTRQKGPTEIWTRIAGFRVQSANHYTMEPLLLKSWYTVHLISLCALFFFFSLFPLRYSWLIMFVSGTQHSDPKFL